MTAQEFGEWQAWYIREQMHPQVDRLRHAQLLAATMNGQLTRKSGGMFTAAEFMGDDPWTPPPAPVTNDAIFAQVALLNGMFKS
jgi:hypothetical protein